MTDNKTQRVSVEQQIPTIIAEMHATAEAFHKTGPGISVFGSARIARDHPYYAQGLELGKRIAQLGLPVIAGGGPGLMEAANRGAFEAGGRSIGLNIRLPFEKKDNTYQTDSLYFDYFHTRKSAFFMNSVAYVVLPGGFGTLDELFEALTLIQTKKQPAVPVILVGTAFWSGLVDWIRTQLQPQGMINTPDLDRLVVSDDVDEIIRHLQEAAQIEQPREPALPT